MPKANASTTTTTAKITSPDQNFGNRLDERFAQVRGIEAALRYALDDDSPEFMTALESARALLDEAITAERSWAAMFAVEVR